MKNFFFIFWFFVCVGAVFGQSDFPFVIPKTNPGSCVVSGFIPLDSLGENLKLYEKDASYILIKNKMIRNAPLEYEVFYDTFSCQKQITEAHPDYHLYDYEKKYYIFKESGLRWVVKKRPCRYDPCIKGLAMCLIEVRSQGVRYKEFHLKDPEKFPGKELAFKDTIIAHYKFKGGGNPQLLTLDEKKVKSNFSKNELLEYNKIPDGFYRVQFEQLHCPGHGRFRTSSIVEIQKALLQRGYDVDLNNFPDEKTEAALADFAKKNGIPICPTIYELLDVLGVKY